MAFSRRGLWSVHRLAIVESVTHVSVLGGLSSSTIDVGSFHLCLCVFRAGGPWGSDVDTAHHVASLLLSHCHHV